MNAEAETRSDTGSDAGARRDRALAAFAWLWFIAGALWVWLGLFTTFIETSSWVSIAGSAGAIVYALRRRDRRSLFTLVGVCAAGFLVEVVGVNTGLVFGRYSYGAALGPKLFGVPLAIGLAWMFVVTASAHVAARVSTRKPAQLLLGSMFILAFDIVMEPAAIALGYWSWAGGEIPLYNYLCWWVLGALFLAPVSLGAIELPMRPLVSHVAAAQLVFFAIVAAVRWI